jgi:Zn-dependent M28 family amino/carboxypeptidase
MDAVDPRGKFVGANDGASGVALLMELGQLMPGVKAGCGVDFIFFDGEEYVFGKQGKYFLGSTHFATEHRDRPPAHRYRAGVVIDMIGDKDLQIYQEANSVRLAPEVTRSVWDAARRAGVNEFIASTKHEVNDDHLPLNEIAGIPTCDLIDFDYPYWHTTRDLPSRCSGESLAKVSRVLLEWLAHQPANLAGAGRPGEQKAAP